MKEKHIPVGIYEREIYIADIVDGKIRNFDVLRYLTDTELDSRRDPDDQREYYKELWQQAVASGSYEESLDTYVEEVFDESDLDDDENFPGKDESGIEYLSEEEREAADKFIEESEDVTVGTWENAGWYSPNGWYSDFKKFDFVFDTPEAKKIAKEYVKSLKK